MKQVKDKIKKILEQWKKNYADYIIQFIFLGLILWLFTTILSNSLKPQTNIEVYTPEISKLHNLSESYEIKLVFNNKADFAGEDLYIYVWGMTSSSWDSSYSTSEHCNRIEEMEVDSSNRFKIYCNFIPPKSKFGLNIDFTLDDKANKSGIISVEYWGKTTPYKKTNYNLSNLKLQ